MVSDNGSLLAIDAHTLLHTLATNRSIVKSLEGFSGAFYAQEYEKKNKSGARRNLFANVLGIVRSASSLAGSSFKFAKTKSELYLAGLKGDLSQHEPIS